MTLKLKRLFKNFPGRLVALFCSIFVSGASSICSHSVFDRTGAIYVFVGREETGCENRLRCVGCHGKGTRENSLRPQFPTTQCASIHPCQYQQLVLDISDILASSSFSNLQIWLLIYSIDFERLNFEYLSFSLTYWQVLYRNLAPIDENALTK